MNNHKHIEGSSDKEALSLSLHNQQDEEQQQQQQEQQQLIQQQEQSTGQEILSIAIPAFLALSIDPLMTLADTAFIGKTAINADALAGVGAAASLLTFSFYLFNFLTVVTTPLVSQRRASNQENDAIGIGEQVLSLAIGLGLSLSFILFGFSHSLLSIMGVENLDVDANSYAISFLKIRSFAAPAIFLSSASTGILRGYLDTTTAFYILITANVINFSLDVLLILGAGMGPAGAAIATTTAEWCAAICFLGVLAGKLPSATGALGSNQQKQQQGEQQQGEKQPLLQLQTQTQQRIKDKQDNNKTTTTTTNSFITIIQPTTKIPSWEKIKPLVIASSSSFLRSFVLQISIAGAAAMAARSGTGSIFGNNNNHDLLISSAASSSSSSSSSINEASAASIAAHQIALQLWLLCSYICDALAAASQALVSNAIGKSDPIKIRNVCKSIFQYSLGLGIILSILLEIGNISGFLLLCFTNDVMTQNALQQLLVIVIVAQPLNSYVFAADGIIQGASEFIYEAKSMVLSVLVAIGSFIGLEYYASIIGITGTGITGTDTNINSSSVGTNVAAAGPSFDTLIHVWYGLIILQFMRALTSSWKIIEADGPIDLFARRTSTSKTTTTTTNDDESCI